MGTTYDQQQEEEWWREEEEEALVSALKGRPLRTNPPTHLHQPLPELEDQLQIHHHHQPQHEQEQATATTNESESPHENGNGNAPPPSPAAPAEPQSSTLASERSIYFDATDGNGNGAESSNGKGAVKSDSLIAPSVTGKKLVNGVHIPESQKYRRDENHSASPLLHSEISPADGTADHTPIQNPHHTVSQETKSEVTEWDVEKVLDQQDTHDLYCPNCHSCITKRVILRKRKRKPKLQDDSKRGKTDIINSSSPPTSNQSNDTALPGLDSTLPTVDNSDEDHVTGPDVFRCLSCFSFFIPSVASFKSFRFFGDGGKRESAENHQQTPSRTGGVKQGGKSATQHVEEVATEDLHPQNQLTSQSDHVSSVLPGSNNIFIQPLNVAVFEHHEDMKSVVGSSTTSVMVEKGKNGVEEKGYRAVIKNREGGEGAIQHVDQVPSDDLQLQDQPTFPSDQISSPKPGSTDFLIQPQNVAVLEHQEDRNGVVGSTRTSVKVEIVKNAIEEKAHDSVIQNKEDERNTTFAPGPSAVPLGSRVNDFKNNSTGEVWNDEQNTQVSSMSFSIHLVENKMETDNKHKDAGYDAMQDQSPGELPNLLPYLDKDHMHENNGSILISSGSHTQLNSNTEYKGNAKVISRKEGNDFPIMSAHEALLLRDENIGIQKEEALPVSTGAGKDVVLLIETEQVTHSFSQSVRTNIESSQPGILTNRDTEFGGDEQVNEVGISSKLEIVKSIVYGGLVESIASLGVVSSAAGGDATTLNILVLGLAYLVGGLFMIVHGLLDLKNEQYGDASDPDDRYRELLGKRTSFRLHATVAVLSYLVFGLVAPVTYCFSFRGSDNKEYKLIAVAVASLLCIALLAIAKVYVQRPPKAYIKTTLYFLSMGVMSSGLSYVTGMMVEKFLERLGWFAPDVYPVPSPTFLEPVAVKSSWASY